MQLAAGGGLGAEANKEEGWLRAIRATQEVTVRIIKLPDRGSCPHAAFKNKADAKEGDAKWRRRAATTEAVQPEAWRLPGFSHQTLRFAMN